MALSGFIRKLIIGKDDNGNVTNEVSWADVSQGQKISLAAGVEKTLTVPLKAYHIKFSVAPGGIVWCGHGATPLVAATSSFANDLSELNPIVRPAFDASGARISTLRFLSENSTFIQVIFYGKYDFE